MCLTHLGMAKTGMYLSFLPQISQCFSWGDPHGIFQVFTLKESPCFSPEESTVRDTAEVKAGRPASSVCKYLLQELSFSKSEGP